MSPRARSDRSWLLACALLLTACDCSTEPTLTDASLPDGPDRTCPPDADGDRIPDEVEGTDDADGDDIPNFEDPDADGDGILDQEEAGDPSCTTPPFDTDGDGTPDYLDTDSDDDGIDDAIEGTGDPDMDRVPSYRDIDSDDDGASDADEAAAGTDPTIADTDGDGFPDLVEIARERIACPGDVGEACGCATDPDCGIPEDDYYVVLPFGASASEELRFETSVRAADVFFLMDTTSSMDAELARVRATIATPDTGLMARIAATLSTVRFGVGQHEDFPFGGYGAATDDVFRLATALEPAERANVVGAAVDAIALGDGVDGPESATEALFHVMTGEGGSWSHSDGGAYTMPRYASDCAEGWGAPCFRDDALAMVLHFTDFCSHQGPPSEDRSACADYEGIAPGVIEWTDLIATMNARGAKYVGINTDATPCADAGAVPRSPCLFMRETATATGAVEDGTPLVYDLPDGGADEATFADTVVGAIEAVLSRVPLDVDTGVRDDPSDGVDARAFIAAREPACLPAMTTDCWVAPSGVAHEDAVGGLESDRFVDVLPGTQVTFRITFRNDSLAEERRARVFVAFVDVRGDGGPVLDTREVYIVVPAQRGAPLI